MFHEKVEIIDNFCSNLDLFDNSLKSMDDWMNRAAGELDHIKNHSHKMVPEDRVSYTMELQEDIAAKVVIIQDNVATEMALLPQGENIPKDAQDFKDELLRIEQFVLDLQAKVQTECNNFSEDVKYWAEYKTGIKEFVPWLTEAEKEAAAGLSKPTDLPQALALYDKIAAFDKKCLAYLKVLDAAQVASNKMTTHQEADDEIAAMMSRYKHVKEVSDEWMAKVDTLVKEWQLLDATVNELNEWVAKDKTNEGENQFSLEKMESTLGELKNIFREKEKLVQEL